MKLITILLIKVVAYSIVARWVVKKSIKEARFLLSNLKEKIVSNGCDSLSYCNQEFIENLEAAYEAAHGKRPELNTHVGLY